MKVRQTLLVGAIGILLASPLAAAPAPDGGKTASPQIVIQAQSIDQLIDKLKKALKNFVPLKEYASIEKDLLGKLDPKQLPGIDPKRPFGFYATLDASLLQADFEKSSAVLMVPVNSEKELVALLGQGKISVEKKDGYYAVTLPNAPVELAMRFHKDYAYIGFAGKNLEMKLLLDPREVISSKETAGVVIKVRIDQIPQDLKDTGLTFLEQAFDQMAGPGGTVKEKELLEQYLKMLMSWYKLALTDGRELIQRFDLDPATGEVQGEMTLDGKPKSEMAKNIRVLPPTKNDFLGIVGKDSVGHVLIEMPLMTSEIRGLFQTISDVMLESFTQMINRAQAPEEAVTAGTEAIKLLGRTLKSGDMDLAASLRGPNKDGLYTAIAAGRLKDTADLERALRGAVKLAPEKFRKALKLDAGKIDGIAVHEIDFTDELPTEMKKAFGKNAKLYIVMAPNAVYVAFGADGMTILKEAMTSKGGPAPIMHAEINAKRLGRFIKTLADPKEGKEYFELLAKLERLTVFTFDITGGEKLSIKYTYGVVPIFLMMPRAASADAPPHKVAPVQVEEKVEPAKK